MNLFILLLINMIFIFTGTLLIDHGVYYFTAIACIVLGSFGVIMAPFIIDTYKLLKD
jgi:hypothetical protein